MKVNPADYRIIRIKKKGPWYEHDWMSNTSKPLPGPFRWVIYYADGGRGNPRKIVFAKDELGALAAFYRSFK